MYAKMIAGGLVGGLIGVALWVGVGYLGYEIGWLAWGIGVLVGMGFRLFNDTDTQVAALLAVLMSGAMLALGKYSVYRMLIPAELSDVVPFANMWGVMDVLWVLLACGSAAKLAVQEKDY